MEWPFSEIHSESTPEGYFFSLGSEKHKVFTERSLARELKILAEKVAEAEVRQKILFCVFPWHNAFSELLANDNIYFFSPIVFSPVNSEKVLADAPDVDFFINSVNRNSVFEIYYHQQLQKIPDLALYVENIFKRVATRIKTIEHFSARWEFNFRRNVGQLRNLADLSEYKKEKPNVLVLAGPQTDTYLPSLQNKNIWCADTALVPLLQAGITPSLVFCLDAGHGSFEHFLNFHNDIRYEDFEIVADPLCFPQILDLGFRKIYSYRNSYPPVHSLSYPVAELTNETGDVQGLMKATFRKLYAREIVPQVIGGNLKHVNHVSHLRGSAYHRRAYLRGDRWHTPEMYLYRLSRRYA